jgi:queuine tRNA-ribosyltransferase
MKLNIAHRYNKARTGILEVNSKEIQLPCFMPVGTRANVKAISPIDLVQLDYEVVLANTYHLMLRPGVETIESLGGIGGFSGWPRAILTDSGGYQVFSLQANYREEGVEFRSVYDGSTHFLSPEEASLVQYRLGSDIQMALDVCSPLPSDPSMLREAMELTLRWGERAKDAFDSIERADDFAPELFGIVQGGDDIALRCKSAELTSQQGFSGVAIGGLSVGESQDTMLEVISNVVTALDENSPRYLMGVGDPVGMLQAVALGVDMFDCVLPTRLARHGAVLSNSGRLHLRSAQFASSEQPIEANCRCITCTNHSRGFLRHLFNVGDPSALRLASIHNLAWMHSLMEKVRYCIADKSLDSLINEVKEAFQGSAD